MVDVHTDAEAVAGPQTVADLAGLLRQLRRRQARRQGGAPVTFRALATATGWSLGVIADYFNGNALPAADRFDVLVQLLGASPVEQGALATARDRVEERRRVAATGRTRSTDRPVPRQLPAGVPGFAGRARQMADMTDLLGSPGRSASTVLCVISGIAGVGKTALAVHFGQLVADRYPDGQLHVNLRGYDPGDRTLPVDEAVRGFLDALGIPPERIPVDIDAKVGLYRSLLAHRRVLVVLDNARDDAQVRALLPGAPSCLVVVTSRSRMPGLVAAEAAYPINLGPLPADEARELLAGRLGHDRLVAENAATDMVVHRCGGLPLALTIVAARAAANPAFPLALLADELDAGKDGLDAFTTGDAATELRTVFSWSYHTLGEPAARLFRLLGAHPGPDFGVPAAASLAGVPVPVARRLLFELSRANLVMEHAAGRYTLHDLLRAYATELGYADEPAALARLVDHYLHTAYRADLLIEPSREPGGTLPPAPPPVATPDLADHEQALAWFATERPVLLGVLGRAASAGYDARVGPLAAALVTFLERLGHWHDELAAQQAALHAAQRLDDRPAQASVHRRIACAYNGLNRFDDAYPHLRQALDLSAALGDVPGQARAHLDHARVLSRHGRHVPALHHAQQACDLYQWSGNRRGEGIGLSAVGWCHAQLGEHRRALAYCQQALAILREMGDRSAVACTWDSLGLAHHHLGDQAQAIDCYRRAVDLMHQLGDRFNEAGSLTRLGDAHHAAGEHEPARDAWRQALAIVHDIDEPAAEQLRTRLEDRSGPMDRCVDY